MEQRIHLNNWTDCFFNLQLEGSPFAMALWAAGKAPEKLSACSQECLEGKMKNNFSGPKKLFFYFGIGWVLLCNEALGSWKSTWKAQCLLPRMSGKENKETTFRAPKNCFLICNWKGLPLQWRFGQLEKHLQYVLLGFVLQANLSFFSIDR